MTDSNGTKIVGIDHGYGNIKTANTVTPTGLHVYDSEPIFQGNILEYGGKFYRFGEGHKEFIPDKSADGDFYIFTLMAIARELSRVGIYEAKIHIATGLPLTWVRTQRESFRAYLMKNPVVDFKFNGRAFHISLAGCSIYPQGYPAIAERISDFKGTNLVADIGSGTVNIMYINNKTPIESKCWTEKLGVNQCVVRIKNLVMDKYGVAVEDSIIENFLRFGEVDVKGEYIQIMKAAAVEYAGHVFESLRRYEYNPDLMRLYIIGGGGCVIKNFGNYDKERVTVIPDICATAKGYEYLANAQLKRKTS